MLLRAILPMAILLLTGTPLAAGEALQDARALYANRTGEARAKAVEKHGGSKETEAAVESALAWLARHQEPDGSWNPGKYEGRSGELPRFRVGSTGLALLAFLGAGYTDKDGKYADNIRRAEEWLMKMRKPNGGLFEREGGGSASMNGYHHAIAALALTESYIMTQNAQVGGFAQSAATYSTSVHQEPGSGWRYDPKTTADTSVTAWFVMQLKSAKVAGLNVDPAGVQGATAFLDKMLTKEGLYRYAQPGQAPTLTMTAVAIVCRQFLGTPNTDPAMVKAADQILQRLPDWKAMSESTGVSNKGDVGFYYWYYGTLAMFQMGGDRWTKWNEAMQTVLLDHQYKGGKKDGGTDDKDGSWDPSGYIERMAGRVYTTAMGALTLEVYYRYAPLYPGSGVPTGQVRRPPSKESPPDDF